MYLSPCHFGCTNQTTSISGTTDLYSSCDCGSNTNLSETACHFRRIPCKIFNHLKKIDHRMIFFFLGRTIFGLTVTGATFVVFFTAFIQVPMLRVLLYSVPLPYQSMALAVRQTIVRVLGQTSGPLLFGFVFDESCLVWLTDCYARRTCKVYNNRRMGLSMALAGFLTRIISGIACAVVYLNWKFKHSNEDEVPANIVPSTTNESQHKNENNETTRL
jgi:hypothetical protein